MGTPLNTEFAPQLIAWQRTHGRHMLPWQQTRDPYRVWLSEIMLQQTQVTTVLGYYARFLERFPEVRALAEASQDEVLALWSGLGYYSRARNLHACAQAVMREHGGVFPRSSAVLQTLPGIGRSTAAAIAAFCFSERVAILDGNVKRVLSRYLAFDGDLASGAEEKRLWQIAESMLPPDEGMTSYTQGLMDLGATVCLPRAPQCLLCPVQQTCAGRRAGSPERFPIKTRKLRRSARDNAWLWLTHDERVWLCQRPQTGVWAGLWSLPEFASLGALEAACGEWPGQGAELPSFTHVLTHLDWTLRPVKWTLPAGLQGADLASVTRGLPSGRWFSRQEALDWGVPSPLRKLLQAG